MPVDIPELGLEDITRMREAIGLLHGGVSDFVNSQGIVPATGSQADEESRSFVRSESVQTAQSQAGILLEVAGDQLTAFIKTITEPFETIAPWTCVRSLLEAASLAAWLFDPEIDVRTRVRRSLALRYEGLDQQVKWLRAAGQDSVEAVARVDDVERVALALGFERLVDGRGKRTGIAQVMPSATEVMRLMLDEEVAYRLLSAVAHGHHWALQHTSFRLATDHEIPPFPEGQEVKALEKAVHPNGVAYLALTAARTFARPAWYLCVYYGWNRELLAEILNRAYDLLRAKEQIRFWQAGP